MGEILSYEKRYGDRSKGIRQIVKEKISLETEIKKLKKENEELKQKEIYLNDCLLGKFEEKIYIKAMGLEHPDDCYDMIPIEGKPNLRECACPPSQRPVHIPRDKKLANTSLITLDFVVDVRL